MAVKKWFKEEGNSSWTDRFKAQDKGSHERNKNVNKGRFQALQKLEDGSIHDVEDIEEEEEDEESEEELNE